MEVLHGNQTGPRHSRRHSDEYALAENRLLDWARHDSDIDLLPHSPLALANVLDQHGGFLDLLPIQPEPSEVDLAQHETAESTAGSAKSPAAQRKQGPRQRFNLLTRHNEVELLQQCKKILVENALIKNKGDRQLYLAAGFISWPSANNADERQRAPLLLYPVLLVRAPEEQRYEIRLTGDTPEFNTTLVQHLEERHAHVLPEYSDTAPLADFFAQVAQALSSTTLVELEFEIALGSASLINPGSLQPAIDLPDLPEHFNVALATSITGNKTLQHLAAVLQLIPDFTRSSSDNGADEQAAPTNNMSSASLLRSYSAKLASEGLDHLEFRQLPELPPLIAKRIDQMEQAPTTQTIGDVLDAGDLSARELIKLSGIIELIDKAPDNIERWGHGDLCYASTTVLLRRAQHQAKLIEDELAALQEHFHLDKVPAKQQLLSLLNELGGNMEQEPNLIDAEYFNARRQFMEFSTNKSVNLTVEHRRSLSQLTKVLRFRELFVNNVEYRSALGSSYKGLRTDWPMLIRSSDYARELAEVLGSEKMAASIINNWQTFRHHFARELVDLQQAADATRQLLTIVGKRWQTQPLSALSAHATFIASRLERWHNKFGTVESHADKTPAIVLSSFSNKSMDHVLIETQVDETQSRIRRQLTDGEITIEQISDTLDWLNLASASALELDLEIESIVEHLHIG